MASKDTSYPYFAKNPIQARLRRVFFTPLALKTLLVFQANDPTRFSFFRGIKARKQGIIKNGGENPVPSLC
jgi:hypothetical protein